MKTPLIPYSRQGRRLMQSPRLLLWVLLLLVVGAAALRRGREAFFHPHPPRGVPSSGMSAGASMWGKRAHNKRERKNAAGGAAAGGGGRSRMYMSIAPQDPLTHQLGSGSQEGGGGGDEEGQQHQQSILRINHALQKQQHHLASLLQRKAAAAAAEAPEAKEEPEAEAAQPQPLSSSPTSPSQNTHTHQFSLAKAALMGPFAFEAYNDPPRSAGWWQQGTDKNEIAIMDGGFLKECYGGVLNVRIIGLTETRPAGEALLAKAATRQGKKKGASVIEAAVSLEVGRDFVGTQLLQLNKTHTHTQGGGLASYAPMVGGQGEGEGVDVSSSSSSSSFSAFLTDPWQAHTLRFTIKGKDDTSLGMASLNLSSLLLESQPAGDNTHTHTHTPKRWQRDLSLISATGAGAAVEEREGKNAGDEARQRLSEAALGVRVEVDMQYVRFTPTGPVPVGSSLATSPPPPTNTRTNTPSSSSPTTPPPNTHTHTHTQPREWRGATGCSRDWRELAEGLGGEAVTAADFELLCYVDNKQTDTQVKLWRDEKRKRLLVAFRGTQTLTDVIMDLKLLQEPWDPLKLDEEEARKGKKEKEERGKEGKEGAQRETQTQQQQQLQQVQQGMDFYAALASQANNTFLLYNQFDKTVRDLFGHVWKNAPFFSSSSQEGQQHGLPPSYSLSEVVAEHHRLVMVHGREQGEEGEERNRGVGVEKGVASLYSSRSPLSYAAPGLHLSSSPSFSEEEVGEEQGQQQQQQPQWARPFPLHHTPVGSMTTSTTNTHTQTHTPPPAPAPTHAVDAAVTSVLMSVLDKMLGGITPTHTHTLTNLAEFRRAFYEVATSTASALGQQLFPTTTTGTPTHTHTQTEEEGEGETEMDFHQAALAEEEEEKQQQQQQEKRVLALVGKDGKSPLFMLPSRFKGIFATLVDQTLQAMATTALDKDTHTHTHTPDSAFRAGLFSALDRVVTTLQHKQLQDLSPSPTPTPSTFSFPLPLPSPPQNTHTQTQPPPSSSSSSSSFSLPLPSLDTESFGVTEEARVHAGFKEAYLSVRSRLHELIGTATGGEMKTHTQGEEEGEGKWELYITGHSLGGALASLAAHDLSVKYPEAEISMYNFGCPRVGNKAFAEAYTHRETSSYRLVNENDVFTRFPRNINPTLFQYTHVGKTVLLNEGSFSIEGEEKHRHIHTTGESETVMDSPPLSLSHVRKEKKKISVSVGVGVSGNMHVNADNGKDSKKEKEKEQALQLEPLFLEAEWQMLNALLNGAALTSHMEYRYFESLLEAQRKSGGTHTHTHTQFEEEEMREMARSLLSAEKSMGSGGGGGEGGGGEKGMGLGVNVNMGGLGGGFSRWITGMRLPLTATAAERPPRQQ